jgi:N6-L-threonylcarbamoyladenine synthase
MLILGIDTSCDETSAGIVEDGLRVKANIISSQAAVHAQYGGVVPEVASRHHMEAMIPAVQAALNESGATKDDLDAIAVTAGPGLAGCLLVGLNTAKSLSYAWSKPLIAVNHLEGHIYANWLDRDPVPEMPAIILIVSGAHTELVLVREHGDYELLGSTRDDAAGEAFDKAARLLGLGFPGGPLIQRKATEASAKPPRLPRAMLGSSLDFSFSGLKTAVRTMAMEGEVPVADIASAFQTSVVDVLTKKTKMAVEQHDVRCVLLSGGVAANGPLRASLQASLPVPVFYPPPILCTDNGAMIAAAAYYRAQAGATGLSLDARPSWPIALPA